MTTTTQWMSREEVAAAYGVTTRTIYNWADDKGKLPPSDVDTDGRWWRRCDVMMHVRRNEKAGRFLRWERIK